MSWKGICFEPLAEAFCKLEKKEVLLTLMGVLHPEITQVHFIILQDMAKCSVASNLNMMNDI